MEQDVYWFLSGTIGKEHKFETGRVLHLQQPDVTQEVYGLPEWLSALQSDLLAENATLFRRRYYLNGAHAGFVFYVSDAQADQKTVDELTITLHNTDGKLAIPEPGKVITLALGWRSGADVPVGLVDKGRFTVGEIECSGPPDQVQITARSTDLNGDYRKRHTQVWNDTTVGAVLNAIAKRNAITAQVHPDLAGKTIKAIDQHSKSDMLFVKDLGSRYDAVATWKDRTLIFMPVGTSTTASGKKLEAVTLTKHDGWSWRFTRAQRDEYDGVEASWHDQDSGKTKKHSTGGKKSKRLKRKYASEAEAKQATSAEASKRKRGAYQFEYDLAVADTRLQRNMRIKLSGWGAMIDGVNWLISNVETTMQNSGIRRGLSLESASSSSL